MEVWKIIFLFKWVVWRFHVNLPGCSRLENDFLKQFWKQTPYGKIEVFSWLKMGNFHDIFTAKKKTFQCIFHLSGDGRTHEGLILYLSFLNSAKGKIQFEILNFKFLWTKNPAIISNIISIYPYISIYIYIDISILYTYHYSLCISHAYLPQMSPLSSRALVLFASAV